MGALGMGAATADAAIDEAAKVLGTDPESGIDEGPQDVHDGDPEETEAPNAQLTFNVGGKRPTTTSLRLTGGKLDIPGSYAKGAKLVIRVEVRVGEVAFVDEHDQQTGQVIGCERRHKARILNHAVLS